jgi:hypothetical protein
MSSKMVGTMQGYPQKANQNPCIRSRLGSGVVWCRPSEGMAEQDLMGSAGQEGKKAIALMYTHGP